jgi:hypothetical protein
LEFNALPKGPALFTQGKTFWSTSHFNVSMQGLHNIKSLDTTKRGVRGWKEVQRQGEDRVTLCISLLCPQNFAPA